MNFFSRVKEIFFLPNYQRDEELQFLKKYSTKVTDNEQLTPCL